jgi:glycerol-3-phosphate acyltransferase PlsY
MTSVALVMAYVIGSLPISFLVARFVSGTDLRTFGNRTISGTNVGLSSGFPAMALAGVLDIAKGAVAVAPVASRPGWAVAAAGCAVVGHNWSVFLMGAGGRGISPGIGATAVLAWPGAVLLGLGLILGKATRHTSLGSFIAQASLPLVMGFTHGSDGAWLGVALLVPMWLKRMIGNGAPPSGYRPAMVLYRLARDHDRA